MKQRNLEPGWYVRLEGHKFDLADWREVYCPPFNPVVVTDHSERALLYSREMQTCVSGSEAWEKAIALVGRLNGAVALVRAGQPIKPAGIIHVGSDGKETQHLTMIMGAATFRSRVSGAAIRHAGNGEPIPEPEPVPSAAQALHDAALSDDDIADLLEQLGRSDNWYDIYKAIEIAQVLCGGQHKLFAMLEGSRSACENMRKTANFFRHARAPRPAVLTELPQAVHLLHFMAQTALNHKLGA
jgi:hypothetical protein